MELKPYVLLEEYRGAECVPCSFEKFVEVCSIAVGTGTWGIAAVIPKYLSLRLPNNYNVYEAPVTYNAPTTNTIEGEGKKPKVTDEQIARALVNINGKQKAVDSQRAWLGVCCLLGWKYNFPRNLMDCCKRIDELPIKNEQLEFQCKYESIRMYGNWKFVKVDYKEWPNYTPRDDERQMFEKCLAVANALDEEIEKQGECDS